MRSKIFGEEHPDIITAMGNLAATFISLEKYADAEKLQMNALSLCNKLLGEEHPNTISTMGNLAATYKSLGKYTDVQKLQIKILESVQLSNLPRFSKSLITIYSTMGNHQLEIVCDACKCCRRVDVFRKCHILTQFLLLNPQPFWLPFCIWFSVLHLPCFCVLVNGTGSSLMTLLL